MVPVSLDITTSRVRILALRQKKGSHWMAPLDSPIFARFL